MIADSLSVESPGEEKRICYDRTNGLAYFFPKGSPATFSKTGKKKEMLDKFKLNILEL